jgi:nucleoside-diphosphate-sugar epimerase
MKSIAILGANAHLARSLLHHFSVNNEKVKLDLFTRDARRLVAFLSLHANSLLSSHDCKIHSGYAEFLAGSYDVVINCVGVGTLSKHGGNYNLYFSVYEQYDNLVISYLQLNQSVLYLAIGSGAVYGKEFDDPASEIAENRIRVNNISPSDFYSIAKVYSEAKHRSLPHLRIVDIRIFSFFSRFYDPLDGYLVNQIIQAVLDKSEFVTDKSVMCRDYIHPADYYRAVSSLIYMEELSNCTLDLFSKKPVFKSELIEYFNRKYGLRVVYVDNSQHSSATGEKKYYYSIRSSPFDSIKPRYTSIESVANEAVQILR